MSMRIPRWLVCALLLLPLTVSAYAGSIDIPSADDEDALIERVHERFIDAANGQRGLELATRKIHHNGKEWAVVSASSRSLTIYGNGASTRVSWDQFDDETRAECYADIANGDADDRLGAAIQAYRADRPDLGDDCIKQIIDEHKAQRADLYALAARLRGESVPEGGYRLQRVEGKWRLFGPEPVEPEPAPEPQEAVLGASGSSDSAGASASAGVGSDAPAGPTVRPETGEQPYREYDGPDARGWRGVRLAGGVYRELQDLRSLSVLHERVLEPGEGVTIDGHEFINDPEADRPTLIHREPADDEGVRDEQTASVSQSGKQLTFEAFGTRYGIYVRLVGDRIYLSSAYGAQVRLGREKGWIIDCDLDGRIGTIGDGAVTSETRTVAPWTNQLWTPDEAAAFRYDEESERWEQGEVKMPHPGNSDHTNTFKRLNWRRMQVGVPPCQYDTDGERDIIQHLGYCAANGGLTHPQDPNNPHYDADGHAAGMDSVLGRGNASHSEAFRQMYLTMYHRDQMLDPTITYTAFGLRGEYWGMRCRYRNGGPTYPFVCPAHGMVNVSPVFSKGGERPMPGPVQLRYPYNGGTCTTFRSPDIRRGTFTDDPILEVLNGRSRVTGTNYWPGNEPHDEVGAGNFGTLQHYAPRALPGGTLRCRVRIEMENGTFSAGPHAGQSKIEFEWEYTVGGAARRGRR